MARRNSQASAGPPPLWLIVGGVIFIAIILLFLALRPSSSPPVALAPTPTPPAPTAEPPRPTATNVPPTSAPTTSAPPTAPPPTRPPVSGGVISSPMPSTPVQAPATAIPATATSAPATLTPIPPTATNAPPTATAVSGPSGQAANRMFTEVNAARAKSPPVTPAFTRNLQPTNPQPLVYDAGLSTVAEAHARDMATRKYLAHNTPEGRTPQDRIQAAGLTFTIATENIYMSGNADPMREAMDWFMQDQIHRDAILNPLFDRVGIGVHTEGRLMYFVQLFMKAP